MTNEEEIELFNKVNADFKNVIFNNAFTGDVLHEKKYEITVKSFMFFTVKMIYDQGIPADNLIAYVRGVYEDLAQIK